MQEENNNNETIESAKKGVSIGALLVNARTAASLNQTDIAEQINLPKTIIQALETDDYDSLPETTYIRGYLRNYARVVGVNGDGLVKLYVDQYYHEPAVERIGNSKQSYDPAILWSTAAVLTILVGLVITWWFDTKNLSDSSEQLAEYEAVVDEVLPAVGVSNQQESETTVSDTENSLMTSSSNEASSDELEPANKEEVISADQQEAMAEASRNPTLVTSLDGAYVLTVTYTEESWTEIRDAEANTLIQGLIEPGVVRNLSGKPPFEVFLGNAPGVVIEFNGLYFDHSQYSRNNRTARFQVSSGSLN